MKIKKALAFLPLVTLLLTGCIGKKTYAAKEYMIPVPWKGTEDFRILQLSDIHLSQSDNHEMHMKVIEKTIDASKPNLIVLNGDIFTFADKHVVKKFFKFIDSKNILWTFTFGNHDDQGYYNDMYIPRLLDDKKAYTHALFKNLEDDDVTGRSNFVLNIKDSDTIGHPVVYQVYLLDSHSYNFDTGEYDFIKQDQIDWYERCVKYSTDTFGSGTPIKSALYMHIGMPECVNSWEEVKNTEDHLIGDMQEFSGSPSEDLHFFERIKQLGSTRSIHVAHDHANDSVVRYQGIFLAYGEHSTNRIYNDDDGVKLGGQLMTINKATKKLTFYNYRATYESETAEIYEWKGEAE